jgi:putative membrane protein
MQMKLALLAASICISSTVLAAPSTTDVDFVSKAAQAGMAEVAAGKVAEANGQSASVKAFGKRMIADHTTAGDELKKVADKSGITMPTSPSSEQQQVGKRLEGLKGADFDKAYADQMVKDHEDAVTLFTNEASSGSNADLKSFAKKTLPTLQEHLKMAHALPEGTMSKSQ